MDEEKAREILGDRIQSDGSLSDPSDYLWWYPGSVSTSFPPRRGTVCMDGDFSSEELKAIAWWMENKGEPDGGDRCAAR